MAECRRSVLSCARCRRRKIKCDRAIPCAQCVSAKAECTGFSSKDQDPNVPRSIVQHLEAEIARVEGELARNGHLEDLNASDILAGMPTHNRAPFTHQGSPILDFGKLERPQIPIEPGLLSHRTQDPARTEIMQCGELQAMMFSLLPSGPGITDLLARVRMSLTPSTAVGVSSPRENRRKSSFLKTTPDAVSCHMLKSMPVNIMRSLIKKYMTRVFPTCPILHAPTVWQHLEKVVKTLESVSDKYIPPSYEFLVIYILLSVSATLGSAKSGHESRHMIFSGSLFEEGIQHLSGKAQIPSDLAGVQVTLLILQYASINPRLGNVWVLSGAVMRSCLELGLHREPPDLTAYDKLHLDLRRRIFWSAYCSDRSICSALQRPLTIPDETIDAQLPSNFDDRHVYPNGPNPSMTAAKMPLLKWVEFRRLQSTMTAVHFQNKALEEGQSWDDWLVFMEAELEKWSNKWKDGPEFLELGLSHAMMNLHRPSPAKEMPSPRSLMRAFDSACESAKRLREHTESGFYRRPWMIAHNLLENSMVVLFCLKNGFDIISAKHTAQQIFEMTKVFTAVFLMLASQGWSEVSSYAGIYERLLGPLLESVFSNKPPSLTSFGPTQEAELARLLYPGPAQLDKLRFGTRPFGRDEFTPFDASNINWDDFSVSDSGPLSNDFMPWDLTGPDEFMTTPQDALFAMP